jgi:hypothetical protein
MSALRERIFSTDASTHEAIPLQVNLQYKLRVDAATQMEAGDRVIGTISSGQLVFRSGCQIQPRLCIDMIVDWPCRLDDGTSFQLHAEGETQEPKDGCTVVKILRHQFRACRRRRTRGPGTALTGVEPKGRMCSARVLVRAPFYFDS